MSRAWKQFKRDRFFLTRQFAIQWLALGLLVVALIAVRGLDTSLDLRAWHLALTPLSVFLGVMVPVFMHNCTHGNFRSRFVDDVLGELAAQCCLSTLSIIRVNHVLHHAFHDTAKDPHPPGQQSFWRFFLTCQVSGSDLIEQRFLAFHGDTAANRRLFTLNRVLHYGAQPLRAVFFYLLAGPELFVTLLAPSFLVFSFGFAHVNYKTHASTASGETELLNKNDTLYYKFVNAIGSGIYFHANHHRAPRLLNPSQLDRPAPARVHALSSSTARSI